MKKTTVFFDNTLAAPLLILDDILYYNIGDFITIYRPAETITTPIAARYEIKGVENEIKHDAFGDHVSKKYRVKQIL